MAFVLHTASAQPPNKTGRASTDARLALGARTEPRRILDWDHEHICGRSRCVQNPTITTNLMPTVFSRAMGGRDAPALQDKVTGIRHVRNVRKKMRACRSGPLSLCERAFFCEPLASLFSSRTDVDDAMGIRKKLHRVVSLLSDLDDASDLLRAAVCFIRSTSSTRADRHNQLAARSATGGS